MDGLLTFLSFDRIVEIAGLLVGLAYLYFEYHANRLVWLMSVIMPLISVWVYFRAGLYADFAINIYYFLIAVYGYIVWTRGLSRHRRSDALPVSHIPFLTAIGCVVAVGALYLILYYALSHYTNSTVPRGDAFTTALSIVAMWMLARKYAEQWLAWLVVDAVCVGLYLYKGIYFYAVLYAVYTVIAVFGYRKWLTLMPR